MHDARWLLGIGLMLGATPLFAAGPQSGYVRNNHGKGVIVFVHGLTGDGTTTWTNESTGAYWPDMVSHDKLFDGFDIYVYEYPSPRLSNTYLPDELAEDMRLHFASDKILQHDQIVFLVHSLGGIVTRSYLTKYRKAAEKVAFVYFFSTPTTGSDGAGLAALISKNPQVGKLRRMTSTDYLADLQRQWFAADFKFPSYCAYEVQKTYGLMLVDQSSAASLCNHLEPIDANHIQIVKPADSHSPSYLTFRAAFEQEVVAARVPTQNAAPGVHSEAPSTSRPRPSTLPKSGQQSVPPNSTVVGPVTIQSGAVASFGQQGGQTAGTIINNGPPPPPTPTITACITTAVTGADYANTIKLTTDTAITEPWYAFFFDGPVLDGKATFGDHTFGYSAGRADKFPEPEKTAWVRFTNIDSFGTSHWIPGQEITVIIPSKRRVQLVRITSGSGEDGRAENFTFPCGGGF